MGLFGLFFSSATTNSDQEAQASIAQSYSGNCSIQCANAMNDIYITVVGSTLYGGIALTQSCAVDGKCLFNVSADSVIDTMLKAKNSSNADAATVLAGVGINISTANGRQSFNEQITESVSTTCSIGSSNQMNNVNVFIGNSTVYGAIDFSQSGNVVGNCTSNVTLKASAYASGILSNEAASGKAAKGSKFSGKSTAVYYITMAVIAIVILITVLVIAKMFASRSQSTPFDILQQQRQPMMMPQQPPPYYMQPRVEYIPEYIPEYAPPPQAGMYPQQPVRV
jgi:hypothetical protein